MEALLNTLAPSGDGNNGSSQLSQRASALLMLLVTLVVSFLVLHSTIGSGTVVHVIVEEGFTKTPGRLYFFFCFFC